jgi:DNA-binding CsgD family transcriptional regulator
MFAAPRPEMLANMTETDPRADMPQVNWSELGVGELPTGTVTLLLADVEGSTRLWETQPEDMTAAFARLDRTLTDLLAVHGWASLTPAELDVVRLVSEGLGNKEIATRLFISPRTVETHLTHLYTKLGLASRVQLAQEAARHA